MLPELNTSSELIPSIGQMPRVTVDVVDAASGIVGVPVGTSGPVPPPLAMSRSALEFAGFTGAAGQALLVPGDDHGAIVAIGVGDASDLDVGAVRDAAAAFANAVPKQGDLSIILPPSSAPVTAVAQAVVEGVLLARYRYEALKQTALTTPITSLTLLTSQDRHADASTGAELGRTYARATMLARDLANAPAALLTAERIAEIAVDLGAESGLIVEVFDEDALVRLGCGGLLGVNAGSADPPMMIKLTYRPKAEPKGHLSLVGKGIMYDSGGISLKPGDLAHSQMKNDMSGAGAILSAMSVLSALDCPNTVTGFLMCTDNMPSGTAMKLGDVISIHGGMTVEVLNTDAEGRLVMSDALVLATEEGTDAVVDIATLTGACLRALGPEVAGVFGTDQGLVDQVLGAAGTTGEPAWQLPLDRRYRKWLDSPIADIRNVGGESAGAITAALFLSEFVGDTPWAHIDIAGTAQNDVATSWRPVGCTGYGARLLLELSLTFRTSKLGADRDSVAKYALTGTNA
jgi:leucyl aminopeptidase